MHVSVYKNNIFSIRKVEWRKKNHPQQMVLKWPRKLCDHGQTNSFVCRTLLQLVFEMTMSKKKSPSLSLLLLGVTYIFPEQPSSCLITISHSFTHVKFYTLVWSILSNVKENEILLSNEIYFLRTEQKWNKTADSLLTVLP